MRVPRSSDTRLFVAGLVAFGALVVYVAVAFATTHASAPSGGGNTVAPWTPYHAKLIAVPRAGKTLGYDVQVNPTEVGTYGGLVPTVVSNPISGRTYIVGLWLKGSRGGPIGVEIDEFAPGATSVYVVNSTVQVGARWRRYTFNVPVKGTWLGLGMYVHRDTGAGKRTWFSVRGPTEALAPR